MAYIIRHTPQNGAVCWITPTGVSRLKKDARKFLSDHEADKFIENERLTFVSVEQYIPSLFPGLLFPVN